MKCKCVTTLSSRITYRKLTYACKFHMYMHNKSTLANPLHSKNDWLDLYCVRCCLFHDKQDSIE